MLKVYFPLAIVGRGKIVLKRFRFGLFVYYRRAIMPDKILFYTKGKL